MPPVRVGQVEVEVAAQPAERQVRLEGAVQADDAAAAVLRLQLVDALLGDGAVVGGLREGRVDGPAQGENEARVEEGVGEAVEAPAHEGQRPAGGVELGELGAVDVVGPGPRPRDDVGEELVGEAEDVAAGGRGIGGGGGLRG